MFERDLQYEAHRLDGVDATTDPAGWHLHFADGFGIWCPASECAEPPAVGETARLYGKGFGYVVRGIVIEGRVYRYLTEAEAEADHAAWVAGEQRQRQEQLERELPDRDRRRSALPEPFRLRIEGFIGARPYFRRDNECYELFCCEEAALLARHFAGDIAGLKAFAALSHEEQKAALPALRLGEHSGNTFNVSLHLAWLALERPELVPLAHGALCPLVGCAEYGCHAARRNEGEPVLLTPPGQGEREGKR